METRQNGEVLCETVALDGKDVIDIGCGDGALVRLMTRKGARATGLDPGPAQLAKARGAEPTGDEKYVEGVGEDMPFDDASADVVVFFNSLHHVANERQPQALSEAVRVLRPGGILYVAEPLAEGPQFELTKTIDDETAVRAHAYRVIKDAGALGLTQEQELFYVYLRRHKDFEDMRDKMVSVDPAREGLMEEHEAEMRANYERLGTPVDGGAEFAQPIRVNLLRKG